MEETLLKMGKECTEPGGIKSIIQHFLLSSKDKDESNDSNHDLYNTNKDKVNKISKKEFFTIFGIL